MDVSVWNLVLFIPLLPFVTIVVNRSSGHWTAIISDSDCPIVDVAVFAMDEEPPELAANPIATEPLPPASGEAPEVTVTLAESDASAENAFAFSLLTESVFVLEKPVSIMTEAPCVLLATRRHKPRMVLSGAKSGAT